MSSIEIKKLLEVTRMKGKVKFFNPKRGYGFIIGLNAKDYYVHFSTIDESGSRLLQHNDEVEFEEVFGPKGPMAVKVKRLVK